MAGLLFFCSMRIMILLAAIVISFGSCAQMNKSIVKAEAFYMIPTPGTIAVDDAGQPIPVQRNKVYSVFMEVKDSSLQWTKAWADNKFFSIIPLPINGKTAMIGNKKENDQKVVMAAGNENILLQLELAPNELFQKPPQLLTPGEVLLEGKRQGKLFYYKVSKAVELASPMYQ
ncbi:MAG: hypothetical protein JWR72_3164 [Flavisolibacter sp.]|nr:hypothetical protein [Flavisolibacter sp.]